MFYHRSLRKSLLEARYQQTLTDEQRRIAMTVVAGITAPDDCPADRLFHFLTQCDNDLLLRLRDIDVFDWNEPDAKEADWMFELRFAGGDNTQARFAMFGPDSFFVFFREGNFPANIPHYSGTSSAEALTRLKTGLASLSVV